MLELASSSFRIAELPAGKIDALYVHIPFCFHKCHYCDFYSITRQTEDRMAGFVERILAEAVMWSTGRCAGRSIKPRTIFFGGGTPTLLPREQMRMLIDGLKSRFDFSDLTEFTCEANPATVDFAYCQMLREAGVDRMSFGAQSFDRKELSTLERHHDPDDVPRSVEIARSAGFERINVDLIYAVPGQSFESWQRSLDAAIALKLQHYSCYGLTYEPNTAIAVRKRLNLLTAAPDELELAMLHHTRTRLTELKIPPYEISNYSAAGEECRHNLMYWTGGSYVGLGPSAASHVHGNRFRNRPHLGEWERAIDAQQLAASDCETLSPRQRAGELVMLMLRLSRGIHFEDFMNRTNLDAREIFADPIDRFSRAGLLQRDDEHFALTEAGIDVADAIASEFLG